MSSEREGSRKKGVCLLLSKEKESRLRSGGEVDNFAMEKGKALQFNGKLKLYFLIFQYLFWQGKKHKFTSVPLIHDEEGGYTRIYPLEGLKNLLTPKFWLKNGKD